MTNHYIETGKLVSGKMGTAYIKLGSETYKLANIKELTSTIKHTISEEQRLGKVTNTNMHKVVGAGTVFFFFNMSILRKHTETFKIDLIIDNNDPLRYYCNKIFNETGDFFLEDESIFTTDYKLIEYDIYEWIWRINDNSKKRKWSSNIIICTRFNISRITIRRSFTNTKISYARL